MSSECISYFKTGDSRRVIIEKINFAKIDPEHCRS